MPAKKMPVITHKLVSVPVIFHDDGEVCPLSRGQESCEAAEDGGRLHFETEEAREKAANVPNLRELAGCPSNKGTMEETMMMSQHHYGNTLHPSYGGYYGGGYGGPSGMLSPSPGYGYGGGGHSWDSASGLANGSVAGARTDSGVGDSVEGSSSGGYSAAAAANNPFAQLTVANAMFASPHSRQYAEDVLFGDENLMDGGGPGGGFPPGGGPDDGGDGVSLGDEAADTVHPLPSAVEFRRYEQKKRMSLMALASITPQQIAMMPPALRQSMDQFFGQLEAHSGPLVSVTWWTNYAKT